MGVFGSYCSADTLVTRWLSGYQMPRLWPHLKQHQQMACGHIQGIIPQGSNRKNKPVSTVLHAVLICCQYG